MSATRWMLTGLPAGSEQGGVVTPAGCRAVDMVATRVRQALAAREELAAIFGERVTRHRTRPTLRGLVEPRLCIYPVSLSPEARPTELELSILRMFIGTFWPLPGEDGPLDDWEPSFASLSSVIRGALYQARNLVTVIDDGGPGTSVQLASHFRPADETFFVVRAGNELVQVHEMAWHFELRVEIESGRLQNVIAVTG